MGVTFHFYGAVHRKLKRYFSKALHIGRYFHFYDADAPTAP